MYNTLRLHAVPIPIDSFLIASQQKNLLSLGANRVDTSPRPDKSHANKAGDRRAAAQSYLDNELNQTKQ